jgi:hypothetical protein
LSGSNFSIQTVAGNNEYVGSVDSVLALDSNDNPYILFINSTYHGHGSYDGTLSFAYLHLPSPSQTNLLALYPSETGPSTTPLVNAELIGILVIVVGSSVVALVMLRRKVKKDSKRDA